MSATTLRPEFRRYGSCKVDGFLNSVPQLNYVSVEPDEHSRLLNNIPGSESTSIPPQDNATPPWSPSSTLYMIWATISSNPINSLLVFVPLGIVAGAIGSNPPLVFLLNFLAIIPLASVMSFATEELSVKLGSTLGGLVNATFGNAVEMIVSIVALRNNEIRIVQASMLGSILSNLLLILGCSFLAGGIKFHEQYFNATVASTMSSLMAVACASLVIPATIHDSLNTTEPPHIQQRILTISRGTAVVLLVLYVMYLVFQLKTHSDLFDEEYQPEADQPQSTQVLGPWAAGIAILLVTIMVAICANYLIDSINPFIATAHLSKTFIGLILIPIIGNAAEHTTAVVAAWKNNMGLSIAVAIGSSIQMALFVTPFLVLLGWAMDRPMSLHFGMFETVTLCLAAFVVILLIQDGRSNYLEGILCLGMYTIIALAFFLLPDDPLPEPLAFAGKMSSLANVAS